MKSFIGGFMNRIIDIYKNSTIRSGILIEGNKYIEMKECGALFAYYVLTIEHSGSSQLKYYYYPDGKVINLIGKELIFDCLIISSDAIITHIY